MSSSSDRMRRGRVLQGAHVGEGGVRAADLGVISARPARGIVVSDELVESARQEGHTAGFEDGYGAGYTQGMRDAQTHIDLLSQLVHRLDQEADALAVRETTARAAVEDQVVATALQIAEVIVGHELAQPDARGRDAIARGLALAPERGHVTVRLHPADFAAIGDPVGLVSGRQLEIVADPSLALGDCVVDVGACRVDARIGAALERAREVLQ